MSSQSQSQLSVSAVLVCFVLTGSKPFYFEWFKNKCSISPTPDGLVISQGYKFDFDDFQSVLSIDNYMSSNSEYYGNYSCRVSNIFGYDIKSVNLIKKNIRKRPEYDAEEEDDNDDEGQG